MRDASLYTLLGQDLDAYMDAHLRDYEEARKKWAECTIDEWQAGADGSVPLLLHLAALEPVYMISDVPV